MILVYEKHPKMQKKYDNKARKHVYVCVDAFYGTFRACGFVS